MTPLLAALALAAAPASAWARPSAASSARRARPEAEAGLRLQLSPDAALTGTVDSVGAGAGLWLRAPRLGRAELAVAALLGVRGVGPDRLSELALGSRTTLALSPSLALWSERAMGLRMSVGGRERRTFAIGRFGMSRRVGASATLEPVLEVESGPGLLGALWRREPPRAWPVRLSGGLGLRWDGPAQLPL